MTTPSKGYLCAYCDRGFSVSNPTTFPLEDDGVDILIAFVCPDCKVENKSEIDQRVALYLEWKRDQGVKSGWTPGLTVPK